MTEVAKRGRVSMAQLMIPENPANIVQRPDAPYSLNDVEADEWRGIVNSMPADHFSRGNYALLEQMCRHIVTARRLAQMTEKLTKARPFSSSAYLEAIQAQRAESTAISRLARSMRLTQQATSKAESAKLKPVDVQKNPWDDDDDE